MEVPMSSNVKKLYRSKKDRIIGGVCGGLGEYFSIDSTVIRILYILFALTGGAGIFIYLILILIIPEEPQNKVVDAPIVVEKVETPVEVEKAEPPIEVKKIVKRKPRKKAS